MNPRVIVLTGAGGFIGGHLLERLLAEEENRVVVVGRRRPAGLRNRGIFVESDLNTLGVERLEQACGGEVGTVFHLAAATPKTREQANHGEIMLRANVEATWNLLQVLPRVTGRFVFASSLDVYRLPTSGEPVTEQTPVEPDTLYGASKVCAEHFVRIEAQRRGFDWTVLRLGHIYGPGEEAYEKLIPQTIRHLLQGRSPVLFGSGNVRRDFLFVTDAVEALRRAALSAAAIGQTINIVSGRSVTLRETIETLIQISGRALAPEVRSDQPDGISFCFGNERMRKLLGEWPLISLPEGLRREFVHAELVAVI